jgi:hypothetical protein
MASEDYSVDHSGQYRAEFERLGEAGVEDLVVREGRDQSRRAYALRWLEERRHARLVSGAVALHRTKRAQARTRFVRLAVVAAFLVSFGVTGAAIFVFHAGVPNGLVH